MAWFMSDNTACAHPLVMQAVMEVNQGQARSYGHDAINEALKQKFRDVFEHETLEVFCVFNGSAANALGLSQLVQPYEAILAHKDSHINCDECGMPEFFSGAKILPPRTAN